MPGDWENVTASRAQGRAESTRTGVPRLAVWIVAVGVAVSVFAAYWLWTRADRQAEEAVENAADLLADSITDAVDGVVDQLIAVAGLYRSSDEVTRLEFTRFVVNLGVEPGVVGLAYAPIVEAGDAGQFVADVRAVVPSYEIFEFTAGGERAPAGERDTYVPMQWSHPDRAFGGLYGLDLLSIPMLAESIEEAGSLRRVSATPFMQLPGQDGSDSFVVLWPVEVVGTPSVKGYTLALVDLSEFLDARLPASLANTVAWQVFDAGTAAEVPGDWWTKTFEVAGDEWQMAVGGVPGAGTTPEHSLPLTVLVAGVVASLLAGYGVSAYRQKSAARDELERLRELSRAKDQFLASVSHELRTPLTGVVGFIALLQEPDSDLDAGERQRMIDSISRESTDLAAIIDDLLVAARSELDMVAVTSETVDLRPLVEGVVAGMDDERARHLTLRGPHGPWRAVGDPARVRQIVRNLVVNACRYGGDQLEVRLVSAEGSVRLQIADSGAPLPDPDWERIFEPYHRAHRVPSKPEALGIGLSVSRYLARLMGGDLTYRHESGWSLFELSLPVAATPQAVAMVSEPASL